MTTVLALSFALADDARLNTPVKPTSMAVDLHIDPAADVFEGQVQLTVQVPEKLTSIPLHAEELDVRSATLTRGKKTIPATIERLDDIRIAVSSNKGFKKGTWTLTLDYTGPIHTQPYGLYGFEVDGERFLVTQLEADEARTVWPSFDEPAYKVPHQLTVTVPAGNEVVTNGAPVEQIEVEEGVRHVFAATPPIPTYAGALAVGPYAKQPIEGVGVPSHIYYPKAFEPMVGPAISGLPPTMDRVREWFGSDYPYAKLDLIVAKEFAFGAMENPGAVVMTYGVLPVPGRATPEDHYRLSEVLGHEVAHMWFGNEVTLAWWDDLWLNESFAQWLGGRVASALHPDQRRSVQNVLSRGRVFRYEGVTTARPLRTDVDPAAVFETTNFSVYPKGEALLDAVEAWMGADVFKHGVRAYIEAHWGGNATAADLFAALSTASGKDVKSVLEPYLERPGGPVVTLEGDPAGGVLTVAQQRYWKAAVEGAAEAPWPVLLRLRIGRPDGTSEVVTHRVDTAEATLELGPWTWIHPQADGIGYYDYLLDDAALEALLAASEDLSVEERISIVSSLEADLNAGKRTPAELLRRVEAFSNETDLKVIDEVLDFASYVDVVEWTGDDALIEAARLYKIELLAPFLERVGLERREGEPADAHDLRQNLLRQLGWARHEAVVQHARSLAEAFMEDPSQVRPFEAGWAVELVVEDLDSESDEARRIHERLLDAAERAPDPRMRMVALNSAAQVDVAELREAMLKRALDESTPQSDTLPLIGGALYADPWDEVGQTRMLRFVQDNFDAIGARMPPQFRIYLARMGTSCNVERVESNRAFFSAPERALPGVERVLNEAEESARLCRANVEARLPSVQEFIEQRTGVMESR